MQRRRHLVVAADVEHVHPRPGVDDGGRTGGHVEQRRGDVGAEGGEAAQRGARERRRVGRLARRRRRARIGARVTGGRRVAAVVVSPLVVSSPAVATASVPSVACSIVSSGTPYRDSTSANSSPSASASTAATAASASVAVKSWRAHHAEAGRGRLVAGFEVTEVVDGDVVELAELHHVVGDDLLAVVVELAELGLAGDERLELLVAVAVGERLDRRASRAGRRSARSGSAR